MSSRINLMPNMLSNGAQKITSKTTSTSYETKTLSNDVFEKQNDVLKNEFCPDNSPFSTLRETLRKHIYENSGIADDSNIDFRKILRDIDTQKARKKDGFIKELSKMGISRPIKRHANLITGGKIDSAAQRDKVAIELQKHGIKNIVYLKELDSEPYENFAKSHGFDFIKLPNTILDICLASDEDFAKTSSDMEFIADDFKDFMLKLASLVKKDKAYIGCEYGTCRTDTIMYYLSALVDGIDTSHIKTTDAMISNFKLLKRYKDLIK